MKLVKSFLFFATSLCAIATNAQDVVIFRNGEEAEVKVEEITPNEVRYKKTSNPDGPSYIFNKEDIFMIKYKNGEKDVFAPEANVQETAEAEPQSKPIVVKDVTVKRKSPSGLANTYNGAFLTEYEAMNYLGYDYNEFSQQSDRMKKGFNLMLTGAILSAASATFWGISWATGYWEYHDDDYYYDHWYYYDDDYCRYRHLNTPFMVAGIACSVASSITLPIGIVKFATGKTRCHKILKRHYKTAFNNDDKISSYDNSMTFKMNAKPNGFSLSLTF